MVYERVLGISGEAFDTVGWNEVLVGRREKASEFLNLLQDITKSQTKKIWCVSVEKRDSFTCLRKVSFSSSALCSCKVNILND